MGVHTVAMNNRIVESFPKCQFDGGFLADNATRSFDQSHQPVHQRGDSFDFTRHPGLDLEERICVSPARLRSRIGRSVRDLYLRHGKRLTHRGKHSWVPSSAAFGKQAKPVDLLRDSERRESLSDHAGSVPVAATWSNDSFLPQ